MTNPQEKPKNYTAFAGTRLLASGELEKVLTEVKKALDDGRADNLLIFDEETGKQRDFNFRGTPKEVLERALPKAEGPGRPKLGVLCREVSLLPRHWEWLEQQPQGISAAVRRLVDEARLREPDKARAKRVREAAANVMWSLAGDFPRFEEASRALYAADLKKFRELVADWPKDVRNYLLDRVKTAAGLDPGAEKP